MGRVKVIAILFCLVWAASCSADLYAVELKLKKATLEETRELNNLTGTNPDYTSSSVVTLTFDIIQPDGNLVGWSDRYFMKGRKASLIRADGKKIKIRHVYDNDFSMEKFTKAPGADSIYWVKIEVDDYQPEMEAQFQMNLSMHVSLGPLKHHKVRVSRSKQNFTMGQINCTSQILGIQGSAEAMLLCDRDLKGMQSLRAIGMAGDDSTGAFFGRGSSRDNSGTLTYSAHRSLSSDTDEALLEIDIFEDIALENLKMDVRVPSFVRPQAKADSK